MYYTKEQLENKTLSELLRIYIQADTLATEKNQLEYLRLVEGVILNNFTEKPRVKLQRVYLELDRMDFSQKTKEHLKQVKHCAVDISEHLDLWSVGSIADLKKIITERISIVENNLKTISES